MKNRCVCVSAALIVACAGLARAQSFSQDFESLPAGIGAPSMPANWILSNQSSPIGTDTWGVWGTYIDAVPHGGAQQLAVRWLCGSDTSTLSDWLILPVVSLKNGDTLTFWSRMFHTTYPDRLQVRMSTAGISTNTGTSATDVGDFTTLLLDINPTYSPTGYPVVYTQFTATISGLPAETAGRLAFRYFVENGGPNGVNSEIVFIDDVQYTYTGSVTTGACCLSTGGCNIQTTAQCTAANGVFQGLSTPCGNCPQPGACCFADGHCESLLEAGCTAQSGVFRGVGTNCSPNVCPQPGACCLADGTCSTNVLPAACAARTGVFRGTGSSCPAQCPQPYIEASPTTAHETRASAQIATGSGVLPGIVGQLSSAADEADVYDIQVCDPASFKASTVTWTSGGQTSGDAQGRVDTMLWLFKDTGVGVEANDDNPTLESAISNAHVTAPGRYYLAVSGFEREPKGATTGGFIWGAGPSTIGIDTIPAGPAAAEPFGSWATTNGDNTTQAPFIADSGFYTIALLGVCRVDHPCYANCDSSTSAPCLNVNDFGCFLNAFAAGSTYANCDNSTSVPTLNVNDFGCFLNKFAAGCSNC